MRSALVLLSALSVIFPVILAGPVSMRASGKRGLAWPWYNVKLDPAVAKQATYIYNWETYQPQTGTGGKQFIGTQRCYPDCSSSPIADLKKRATDQKWSIVFTVNEPDLQGFAAGDVANWYKTNIAPLSQKKALPAITAATGTNQGFDWLSKFISACNGGCPHQWINLHWYGAKFEDFKTHITNAHTKFPNERIVVTEYALTAPATADQQNAFYKQAVPFLDGLDYVDMHFPFVATTPSLLKTNDGNAANYVGTGSTIFTDAGALSAVGQTVFG